MKTNELTSRDLMIGDWLMHANGTPMQVVKIVFWHFACAEKNRSANCWEYNNKYEPIPLTPEILEKNGFETEKIMPFEQEFEHRKGVDGRVILDNRTRWIHSSNKWQMYIRGDRGFTLYAELTFVHELQQFLRLCKINKEIVV